jgi:hypothetical protein
MTLTMKAKQRHPKNRDSKRSTETTLPFQLQHGKEVGDILSLANAVSFSWYMYLDPLLQFPFSRAICISLLGVEAFLHPAARSSPCLEETAAVKDRTRYRFTWVLNYQRGSRVAYCLRPTYAQGDILRVLVVSQPRSGDRQPVVDV